MLRRAYNAVEGITLGQLFSGLLAIAFLGLFAYTFLIPGCDPWDREEEVRRLEEEAEVLEETITAKDAEISAARQKALQALRTLQDERSAAAESDRALTAKIEALEARSVTVVQVEEEELEELPELEDVELAKITQSKIQFELNPDITLGRIQELPLVEARPIGFLFNRVATEASAASFIKLHSTRRQLEICRETSSTWQERFHVQRNLVIDYETVVGSQQELAEKQAERILVGDELSANQQQRLGAYADRVSDLERKLFWAKWKTVIGAAVGLAAGYGIGQGL